MTTVLVHDERAEDLQTLVASEQPSRWRPWQHGPLIEGLY